MVSIGAIYHLLTRLWNTKIYSESLVNTHFWIHTIGTVIYVCAMWVSGLMQGLMWRATDDYGNLTYTFAESVAAMHPYYVLRSLGGVLVLVGALIMLYNVVMTIRGAGRSAVSA
jgi:cytochrome c oxidase cbb3-type subunit 1